MRLGPLVTYNSRMKTTQEDDLIGLELAIKKWSFSNLDPIMHE